MALPDREWAKRANCIGVDPSLFFPVSKDLNEKAKAICRQCTVRFECLDWAIRTNMKVGIYGGFTRTERMAFIRSGWSIYSRLVARAMKEP